MSNKHGADYAGYGVAEGNRCKEHEWSAGKLKHKEYVR